MLGWDLKIQLGQQIICSRSWERQQIFKLITVAELSQQEYSLILDAKNFLIRPTSAEDFFHNGKIKVQTKPGESDKQWERTAAWCGKNPSQLTRGYNTTPWVWKKELLQYVVQEYKNRGVPLTKSAFLNYYEFDTTWALIQDIIPWENAKLAEGIYAFTMSADELKQRIEWAEHFEVPIWTFHRYHWNNKQLCDISNEFLKQRNIIDDNLESQWLSLIHI